MATTANVMMPTERANLLTLKGLYPLANSASAVFWVPLVATAMSWKT